MTSQGGARGPGHGGTGRAQARGRDRPRSMQTQPCAHGGGAPSLLTLSTARILAQMKTSRGRSSRAELCSSLST